MSHMYLHTCRKFTYVLAISALLSGTAFAQRVMDQSPSVVTPPDFKRDAPLMENPYFKRARERAYRDALKKIPDKQDAKRVDPWADVRSPSSSPK